jgi:hypothetical protein
MCNICTPALANSSLGRHCTPEIYGKYVCAGFLEDKHLVGHEAVASAHPSKCNSSAAEWQCWRNHLVSKVGGQWWSFFNESYCGGADVSENCAWKVTAVQKIVNNTCLLDRVYTAIEQYAPTAPCFSQCAQGAGAGRNVSDPCWVRCVYTAVLGPDGGLHNGTVAGMPLPDIEAGWNRAFADPGQGGCKDLAQYDGYML